MRNNKRVCCEDIYAQFCRKTPVSWHLRVEPKGCAAGDSGWRREFSGTSPQKSDDGLMPSQERVMNTPGSVCMSSRGGTFMANQKIRIKLKAYEHSIIDQSAARIVETA